SAESLEQFDLLEYRRRELAVDVVLRSQRAGSSCKDPALERRRHHDSHPEPLSCREHTLQRNLTEQAVSIRNNSRFELATLDIRRVVPRIVGGDTHMSNKAF